jgi:hypothetical protein
MTEGRFLVVAANTRTGAHTMLNRVTAPHEVLMQHLTHMGHPPENYYYMLLKIHDDAGEDKPTPKPVFKLVEKP